MSSLSALPLPAALSTAVADYTPPGYLDRFYGDNAVFQKWKTEQTEVTERLLLQNPNSPPFLIALLFKLAQSRQAIAKQMNSLNAEKFGYPRFLTNESTYTALTSPRYERFNQKLRGFFLDAMKLFQEPVDACEFNSGLSRYKIEKINAQNLGEIYRRAEQDDSQQDQDLMVTISSTQRIVQLLFPDLFPTEEHLQSLQLLVGTQQIRIGDQWQTLSRHLTWFYQDSFGPIGSKAIELYKDRGFATIVHTPREAILPLLKQITPLTVKLATHRYPDPASFHKDLAEWEFTFFNIMPSLRGSAAISEIFRDALCHIQKMPPSKTMDLDAMTEPFFDTYLTQTFARSLS